MTHTDKEALKLALDWYDSGHEDREEFQAMIENLLAAPVQEPVALEEYDAGLLNDYGGGNVEWWQDYIRAELGRAYEHYQSQIATPPAAPVVKEPSNYNEFVETACALIKAADDAAADRDYMLCSDDCIAVLRGTWKAPLANDMPKQPAPPAQPAPVPLTEQQKQELAENWFAEDWAITKAMGMMYDHERSLGITTGITEKGQS
jgi:hypothetical protein